MRELLSTFLASRKSAEEQAKALADQVNADLDAIRRRMGEVAKTIEETRQAPAEKKVIEARAARFVDDILIAVRGRNAMPHLLALPEAKFSGNRVAVAFDGLKSFEIVALACRDGLIEGLTREAVAAGGDIGPAISEINRQKTLARMEAEYRSLEGAEELLLRALETTGAKAPRRREANPSILAADDERLQRLAEGEA